MKAPKKDKKQQQQGREDNVEKHFFPVGKGKEAKPMVRGKNRPGAANNDAGTAKKSSPGGINFNTIRYAFRLTSLMTRQQNGATAPPSSNKRVGRSPPPELKDEI